MKYISDIMFWISNGLLIPVIVGLLFLFIRSLLILGSMYASYQSRRRSEKQLSPLFDSLSPNNLDQLTNYLSETTKKDAFVVSLKNLFEADKAKRDYLITDYELHTEKKMSSIFMVAKFGPTLGLMGTLIPMGPALVGLSTGDIATMAYNMQVAFATTVIGLFSGAIGYAAKRIAVGQMNKDLNRLSYIADLLDKKGE